VVLGAVSGEMGLSGENAGRRAAAPREGRAVDRLTELLGRHVRFAYTAWDCIVLNGYLDRLQRPENISHFFREVVGAPSVTPEVLMSRTAPYRAWVGRYAQEHAIPFLPAAKGERREDTAAPHDRRLAGDEGWPAS
jgi:hypothetical protein